jgi:hypothetical protein
VDDDLTAATNAVDERKIIPAAAPLATRPAQFDPGFAADPSLARP